MAFVFKGAEQVLSSDVVSGLTISQDDPIVAAIVAYGGIIGGGSLSLMDFQSGSSLLDASASFHGLVAGFGSSDQLYLPDVAFVTATTKKGQHSNLSFTDAASMAPTLPHPAARPIHGERVRRGKRRTRRHPHQFHVATLRLARYFALSAPLRETASSGLARAAVAWPPQR